MATSFLCYDVGWDLSGGQALVMIGRWQKRETIPKVFAPPWLFELPKPPFQNEAECEAIDMETIFYSHANHLKLIFTTKVLHQASF